jgi:hypothetical protein
MKIFIFLFPVFFSAQLFAQSSIQQMHVNNKEYLEYQGVNVMLAWDFYPEGHQGGVGVIQNGQRVATNGDIRLNPTPGQWQPIPKVGKRVVDKKQAPSAYTWLIRMKRSIEKVLIPLSILI